MSDDILEALQRNADSLRRNGWGSAPFDVAAEEIKNLRARVTELEAELATIKANAGAEIWRLREQVTAVREQTARECIAVFMKLAGEESGCIGEIWAELCADRIRKKFGVTG